MARPLKDRINEIRSLRACALRDVALDRLYKSDADRIVDKLNEVEALIVKAEDRTARKGFSVGRKQDHQSPRR